MMTYEAWRISFQSSEQAARSAYCEVAKLRAELVEAKKDAERMILLGEYKSDEQGVVWFGKNPHAFTVGTKFYAAMKENLCTSK